MSAYRSMLVLGAFIITSANASRPSAASLTYNHAEPIREQQRLRHYHLSTAPGRKSVNVIETIKQNSAAIVQQHL